MDPPSPPPEPARPIRITYSLSPTRSTTDSFDYLVVACDPRSLPLVNRTPLETRVCNDLTTRVQLASLFRSTPSPPSPPSASAILSTSSTLSTSTDEPSGEASASPSASPSASASASTSPRPDALRISVDTCARGFGYRAAGGGTFVRTWQDSPGRAADAVRRAMVAERGVEVREGLWAGWGGDGRVVDGGLEECHTHFGVDALADGVPWQVLDAQGEKNTIYISSFAAQDSVVHEFLYGQMLMRGDGGRVPATFPGTDDRDAKFAVIGAGASGLMFVSQALKDQGYENFTIFERSNYVGGVALPSFEEDADERSAVLRDGDACSLGKAYEPMYNFFRRYDTSAFDGFEEEARLVVDESVARTGEEVRDGVEVDEWIIRKTGPGRDLARRAIVLASIFYCFVHCAITNSMGVNDCMPQRFPEPAHVLPRLLAMVETVRKYGVEIYGSAFSIGEEGSGGIEEETVSLLGMFCVIRKKSVTKWHDEVEHALSAQMSSVAVEARLMPRGIIDGNCDPSRVVNEVLVPSAPQADEFVSVEALKSAVTDVLSTTFAQWLENHSMCPLKHVLAPTYIEHGFGALTGVPTYYGLTHSTPASVMWRLKTLFEPEVRAMENAVVLENGWLGLWENMLEKDELGDRMIFNVNFQSIERNC